MTSVTRNDNPPFLTDLSNRPHVYIKDLYNSAAIWFASGNTVYAAAAGMLTGNFAGATAAAGIQMATATYLAARQVKATYTRRDPGMPSLLLASANYATAATLLSLGVMGGPLAIATTALPTTLFIMWGFGHYSMAKLDRIGDVPATTFEKGLKETFNIKSRLNDALEPVYDSIRKNTPGYLVSAFEKAGKVFSLRRLYCLSYLGGALMSLAKPGCALAQTLWARGYYCLDRKEDNYTTTGDSSAPAFSEQECETLILRSVEI